MNLKNTEMEYFRIIKLSNWKIPEIIKLSSETIQRIININLNEKLNKFLKALDIIKKVLLTKNLIMFLCYLK